MDIAVDPHNWDLIVQLLEQHMLTMRNTANEPLSDKDRKVMTEIEESEKLRNQVWKDYRKDREDKLCSRCGSYTKYEIISNIYSHPTTKDLNGKYNYDFYIIDYTINATNIRNKDSLGDVEWGNVCKHCREHILGTTKYPLDSSQKDAERELHRLKMKEHTRRIEQDTEITNARKELNKARRDNNQDEFKKQRNGIEHPTINPNEQGNMEK